MYNDSTAFGQRADAAEPGENLQKLSAKDAWEKAQSLGLKIKRLAEESGEFDGFAILSKSESAEERKQLRKINFREIPSVTVYQKLFSKVESEVDSLVGVLDGIIAGMEEESGFAHNILYPVRPDDDPAITAWFKPETNRADLFVIDDRLNYLQRMWGDAQKLRQEILDKAEEIEIDLCGAAFENASMAPGELEQANRGIVAEFDLKQNKINSLVENINSWQYNPDQSPYR